MSLLKKVLAQKKDISNEDAQNQFGSDEQPQGSFADAIKNLIASKKGRFEKQEINPEIEQYVTKHANFQDLLDPKDTNPRFISMFEQVMGQIGATGHKVALVNNELQHSFTATKTEIYRPDPTLIDELIRYIKVEYNPSCAVDEFEIHYANPTEDQMNINKDGELGNRINHHCSFDTETNIFQHLAESVFEYQIFDVDSKEFIEFSDTSIPIDGGVLGAHYLQAQRYVEFKISNDFTEYRIIPNKNKSGHTILMTGSNPLEALLIDAFEATVSQFILSAMADGQKEVISIFKQITQDIQIPINPSILEDYLYHRIYIIFIGANLKFDINQILDVNYRSKKKFDFLLKDSIPHELKIQWGTQTETHDQYLKTFDVAMGNRTAGFRTKLSHNTKFGKDGKPELLLAPAQTESEKVSFCADIRTLAHSQLYEKASLAYISKGTNFEKKKEMMTDEDMMFYQSDFDLIFNEETQEYEYSKASDYLYYDCLSTLAGYGKLTNSLDVTFFEKKLDISFDYLRKENEPLTSMLVSTASNAKTTIFPMLMKETGIDDLSIIFQNIKNERFFFQDYTKVIETFYDSDEEWNREHTIYFAARIESMIYGIYDLRNRNDIMISDLDFKAQYPLCAQQTVSWLKLLLAAMGQLHARISTDIEVIESRFWEAQEYICKELDEKGIIPNDVLFMFSGLIQVELSTQLQVRSNFPEFTYRDDDERKKNKKKLKKVDLFKKGSQFFAMAELSHALFRYIESHPRYSKYSPKKKIDQMKTVVKFISGKTTLFTKEEVEKYSYGEELFTKFVNLRDLIRNMDSANDEEKKTHKEQAQKLKIVANSSYGNTAEGVSKDDYIGKLYIDPVPVDMVASARWLNNMLDIYAVKFNLKTLYQHTDSGYVVGKEESIEKLQNMFTLVDPLESNFIKKNKSESAVKIDWFACWGKSKNAYHTSEVSGEHKHSYKCINEKCTNKSEFHEEKCPECKKLAQSVCFAFTEAGTASYSYKAIPSYQKVIFDLYHGKTLTEACNNAKILFPLEYQMNINKEPEVVKKIKKMLKEKQVVEVLKWKKSYIICLYNQGTNKREKMYITTDKIYRGMFSDATVFKIKKINKKQIEKRKHLITEIRKLIAQSKADKTFKFKWRGYSKLLNSNNITDLKKALKDKKLPAKYSNYKEPQGLEFYSISATIKQDFPNFTDSQIKELLNMKLDNVEIGEFTDLLDSSLEYEELVNDMLSNPAIRTKLKPEYLLSLQIPKSEYEAILNDLDRNITFHSDPYNFAGADYDEQKKNMLSQRFELLKEFFVTYKDLTFNASTNKIFYDFFNEQLEMENISEMEFNYCVTFMRKKYEELEDSTKDKTKIEYFNPFPKGVNQVSFYKHTTGEQKDFIEFVLENSTTLTPHEKMQIEKELTEHNKGYKHLYDRFKFETKKYYRMIDPNDVDRAINVIKEHDLEKEFDITNLQDIDFNRLVAELKIIDFISLIPRSDGTNYQTYNVLQDFSKDQYKSDGFRLQGSTKIHKFAFSEKTLGDKNKAITQAIINASRSLSCDYVRTHEKYYFRCLNDECTAPKMHLDLETCPSCNQPTKLYSTKKAREKMHNYLYSSDPSTLPCPKSLAVKSQDMRGGTVRAKLKWYPLFPVAQGSLIEKYIANITLKDKIKFFLEENIIRVHNEEFFEIVETKPIWEVIKKIKKHTWIEIESFYGRNWLVELKDYKTSDYNSLFMIGIIAGKNHIMNSSLRINLASSNLINYNLIPLDRVKLQEDSNAITQILTKTFNITKLASFTRNASLTLEDLQRKKNPQFIIDAALECLAQVLIESSIHSTGTKLDEFHITEDIDTKNPEISKLAIRLLNWSLEDTYEQIAQSLSEPTREFQFRNKLGIGQARQGNGAFINSFGQRWADVAYNKGYTQMINKTRRVFNMGKDTPPKEMLDEAKKVFKEDKGIVRIEKQLKSVKVVNDPFHYKMFRQWLALIKTTIKLATDFINNPNNIYQVFKQKVKSLQLPIKDYLDKYIKRMFTYRDEFYQNDYSIG